MFGYTKFNKDGVKILSRMDGKNKDMLMDTTVYKLNAGDRLELYEESKETAVLLIEGCIEYFYTDNAIKASRSSWIEEKPYCLHAPLGVEIAIEAISDSEIMVQSTVNDRQFDIKMYYPEDMTCFVSCEGRWENTAVRDVLTVFDYNNAPYSNMVIGEVYVRQGRWWSYIPHNHPQPEIYYYKFLRSEGFGACFIGEKAYTVKDGSYGAFTGGLNHPQVNAPGYPMYCCCMIRHLYGNPWTERIDDERYTHLLKS